MDIEMDEGMDVLEDDMTCTVCNAEFLDIEDFEVHVKRVHLNEPSKTIICQLCHQIFTDLEVYSLHIRNEHLADLICCKYCNRLYGEMQELMDHEKKHRTAVLYPKMACTYCDRSFTNKNELQTHDLNEHSAVEDGIMLHGCLSILSSLLNMNYRQFLQSLNTNSPYVCAVCDQSTTNISEYIKHLISKKCRSLACDECCNVYSIKSKLAGHISRHMSPKRGSKLLHMQNKKCFKCKSYFTASSLKGHLNTCTGMCCVTCNINFHSVDEYTSHISQHRTKLLPLEVCIYCQRQMVGAHTMAKHIERAHKNATQLYKYHCTDCKRPFKHPKLLFAHFFSKHKNLHPYTCNICNKTFRVRKNFTLHIKLDHKSIGFVEFDDNFHVIFTDKKSIKQSNCQDVEGVVEKIDKNSSRDIDNDSTNCDDSDDAIVEQPTHDSKEINSRPSPDEPKLKIMQEDPIELEPSSAVKTEVFENNKILATVDIENHQETVNNTHENSETDCKIRKHLLQEYKQNVIARKQRNRSKLKPENEETYNSTSDDSDTPLQTICKKMKLKKRKRHSRTPWNKTIRNPKGQNKKFVCNKCNRNCYTYQNYHRHRALHIKNETKVCIKCYATFTSVKELNDHIQVEHSTSKLTETLKKLLEKRKISEKNTNSEDPEAEIPDQDKPLTNAELFRKTIKKVEFEKSKVTATVTAVDSDKISAKKYLENFIPDTNEVKVTRLTHKLSLDLIGVQRRHPVIKLTKFTPEPAITTPRLRMPVKFIDNMKDKCDITVHLVQNVLASTINFENNFNDEGMFVDQLEYDKYDGTEVQNKMDNVPDVAQEVMLVGAADTNKVLHTMKVKDLPTHGDIAIAHLSPQAPYYKISKIGVLDKEGQSFVVNQPEQVVEAPQNITLPNGKTLVSVNPLAHLLDKNAIQEVIKARKPKYPYYKPKLQNIAEAITVAMKKLDETSAKKKKE